MPWPSAPATLSSSSWARASTRSTSSTRSKRSPRFAGSSAPPPTRWRCWWPRPSRGAAQSGLSTASSRAASRTTPPSAGARSCCGRSATSSRQPVRRRQSKYLPRQIDSLLNALHRRHARRRTQAPCRARKGWPSARRPRRPGPTQACRKRWTGPGGARAPPVADGGFALVEIGSESGRLLVVAQLFERPYLHLPHALAAHPQHLPRLLERGRHAAVETVTQLENAALGIGQAGEQVAHLIGKQLPFGRLLRLPHPLVLEQIGKRGVELIAAGRVEGDHLLFRAQRLHHLAHLHAGTGGDLLRRRTPSELFGQLAHHAPQPAYHLVDVHRQPDRSRFVGQRPGDRLADPPGGVGGELVAPLGVELVDRPHQPQAPLLDQIHEGETAVPVALGYADHQAQVGLDQPAAGSRLTGLDGPGKQELLLAA